MIAPREYGWLDPATVLSMGYALHASRDRALAGTAAQGLAARTVARFVEVGTPGRTELASASQDAAYLTVVRLTVLSHGNAISRRKVHYLNEMAEAEAQYRDARHRARGAANTGAVVALVWKAVDAAVLGAVGYLVQVVFPFMPRVVLGQGRHDASAWLLGLLFVVAGKWVVALVQDARRSRVFQAYTWRRQAAVLEYEEGKLHDGRIFHDQIVQAWEAYTGLVYREVPSYLSVMRGDVRTRRLMDRRAALYSRSPVREWFRSVWFKQQKVST